MTALESDFISESLAGELRGVRKIDDGLADGGDIDEFADQVVDW